MHQRNTGAPLPPDYFEAVSGRLKKTLGFKTDLALAEALGFSGSGWANRKEANSVPFQQVITFAWQRGIDLNWLLTGEMPFVREEDC